MTREEMWQAVSENNADYDGLFFYAVKTTGIYCRPSCKSKLPKQENICFFESSDDALNAGFHSCKRCRSDLALYQPMKDIASEIKRMIEDAFKAQTEINRKIKDIGVTQRRLTDIFKEEYGMTPKAYADSLKLQEAKRLLSDTGEKIIDIAHSIGFGSLSSFYSFFKKEIGMTPSEYRKKEAFPNRVNIAKGKGSE